MKICLLIAVLLFYGIVHSQSSLNCETLLQEEPVSFNTEENFSTDVFDKDIEILINCGNLDKIDSKLLSKELFSVLYLNLMGENIKISYNDLLEEFQNYRTSFTGDLGQLLTFRPEVNGGIAASFDGLCNPSIADRLSAAMIYNTYNTVPTYSFTVQIITHEFGHLFGSRHTHACVWNGDNTAIDGCGSCMENPDPTIHNCNNCPRPPIPTNGGTIMSYCHTQSVGINFNLGFGPQPGNVIRNSVASADCLCECVNAIISGPDVICSTGVYTLINLPAGATVTSWKVTPALMVTVSGNDTTKTITKRGFLSGSVTLTVNITTDCGDLTVEEEIYVGATPIAIEGAFDPSTHARVSLLCAGNSYYFKVIETMPPAEPGTSYSWTLTPPPSSGLLPVSGSGTQPTFTFNVSGQYSLSVWKSNDCGDIPASTLLQVFNCN